MNFLYFLALTVSSGFFSSFTEAVKPSQSHLRANVDFTDPKKWEAAKAKADAFVVKLNLTEKALMVTGDTTSPGVACIGNVYRIPRLGFNGMCYQDGPSGYNRADLVSVFPAPVTVAASWDKDLMYQRAFAIGEEFRDKGVHMILVPSSGPLGRHTRGGRNWEGFSPDPYLSGVAMASSIDGFQSTGVQTCSKRFLANEQETMRNTLVNPDGTVIDAISSNLDSRTVRELYLWPFVDAVKAGTTSFMCAYNRLNETYSCENSPLLNDLLKKDLGFRGAVVSDWFATHSGARSINAGLDITMPGAKDVPAQRTTRESWFGHNVVSMVNNGSVPIKRLDDMVSRIMTPYFLLGQDKNFPTVDPSTSHILRTDSMGYMDGPGSNLIQQIPARDVRRSHAEVIRKIGAESTILLKNVNSTLPLKDPMNIGVFGNDASDLINGMTYLEESEFGTMDIGGGSGTVRHANIIAPLEANKTRARKYGARVQYSKNSSPIALGDFRSIYPTPDVCLVFLKTFASEGYDRVSLENDWNSTAVVIKVAKRCPNIIVISHSTGVNTLPWANNPNVTAILNAHYPGEGPGNSIVDVLWGDVNSSGGLPYTIPANESDYDIPIVTAPSGIGNW